MTPAKIISIVLVALIALIQLQLWVVPGAASDRAGLIAQLQHQTQENEKAAKAVAQLAAIVEDLKAEGAEVEATARYELGMVAPNEIFVNIREGNN